MSIVDSAHIDEIHKTTYIHCILNATIDLSCLVTLITSDVESINDAVKNIKIVEDAKIIAERILLVFNSVEEKIKKDRTNFLNDFPKDNKISTERCIPIIHIQEENHHNIISVENEQIPSIDEIEISSSSDIEIVNEIKYLNSNNANVFNEDEYINQLKDKKLDIQSEEEEIIKSNFAKNKNLLIESVANKQNQCFSTVYAAISLNSNENVESKKLINVETENNASHSNLKSSYYLLDDKLQKKCSVLLKRTSDVLLNKKNIKFDHTKKSLEDKKFSKLINLNIFKKKSGKRNEPSSDCSSMDYSEGIVKSKKYSKLKRKEKKKLKLTLSNDETDSNSDTFSSSSYLENSKNLLSSDIESDCDIYDININKCNTDEEIEERLEEKLLASDDSSETFETDDEGDHSVEETHKKTKKRKLKSSTDSLSSEKNGQNFKKSKWLKDKLLNFKLSDLDRHKEIIKKTEVNRSIKETNEQYLNKNYGESNRNEKNKISTTFSSIDCQSINHKDVYFSDQNLSTNSEMETENSQESLKDCQVTNVNNNSVINNGSATNYVKYKQAGRRNIRKLFDDEEITENTKQAVKDEEARLQRLAERKKQLLLLKGTKEEGKLILDFDIESNEELVAVDNELVKFLKPHQEEGIRFMWDSCFESVELSTSTNGSGCILAHCMGLGKTFQTVTLSHTLLTNKIVGVKTIMVVCPMNTVWNWLDEFDLWLKNVKTKISVYEIIRNKKMSSRLSQLELWHEGGGVLIISYDMLRSAVSHGRKLTPWQNRQMKSYLLNPGADLVVCDEGHLLKNEESLLAHTMQRVKTKRRIILTGTPLQNNLSEYHCMVQFVKQNLLGTKVEFQNRFGNPITNGQFDNSTPQDVKLMKQRAFVLHRMLEGCVQRCDYAVLTPFLPPKQEYVILIHLSELQKEMYKYYINNVAKIDDKHCSLFKNYHEIKRLVAHPMTMQLKIKEKKNVNDNTTSTVNNNVSSADVWWFRFLKDVHLEDLNLSNKLMILFGILERCEKEENKVLVFSQCLHTLDVIEIFLKNLDSVRNVKDNLFNFQAGWKCGLDYFRLDGNCSSSNRNVYCKTFNDPSNNRARLLLISTKAGGLGINLTGANRVVIFDPSWNPSNDVQSIFRVFRFGQQKACYIYRFLTAGTMEEKIYNRQVTKLSLSLRVLDEQQIQRHYRDNELAELYKFEPLVDNAPIKMPKDRLLEDLFLKYKGYIHNIFEHDSLLENKEEEELDEDERKQAWFEYEQEKLVQQRGDVGNKCKGKPGLKKRTKIENNLKD